jgi:CRISPR-associated protein Cmr4
MNVIGMIAETAIHPGSGQAYSVIDLPVAREAATNYPYIAGSSVKGAFRQKINDECDGLTAEQIFGKHNHAGEVAVTDARLLLLPIRSLNGHYRWVTCPYLLERLARDMALVGKTVSLPAIHTNEGTAIVGKHSDSLYLEELLFDIQVDNTLIQQLSDLLRPLIASPSLQTRLNEQLIIISNDEFAYFARYGLAVTARNVLEEETKRSKNLWYEETLPPDTLMYTLLLSRGESNWLQRLLSHLHHHPYIQIGGNETIGQGWFQLQEVKG